MERWRAIWERYHRLLIVVAIGCVAVGVYVVGQPSRPVSLAGSEVRLTPSPGAASELTVDVEGAVRTPGLYKLPAGSLVEDAILAAGNLTPEADGAAIAQKINRAEKLKANQKLYLPTVGGSQSAGDSPSSGSGSGEQSAAGSGPVNLNAATQAELEALPGVGPATAGKIIQYRDAHGGFQDAGELMDVSGIGEKTFEKLKDLVSV